MIAAFVTGVVVAIPTSLITMKLLNSSLFISNTELKEANAKISLIINNLDDFDDITNEEVGYKLIQLLKVCNCQEDKK